MIMSSLRQKVGPSQRHPDLLSAWRTFRNGRADARAVRWLADEGLVDDDTAQRFFRDNPETRLP